MKNLINDDATEPIEPVEKTEPIETPIEKTEVITPEIVEPTKPIKKDNTAINLIIIVICVMIVLYLLNNYFNKDE